MARALDPVIKELRELILLMGSRSEAILGKSVRAMVERSVELADEVKRDDLEIDRIDVQVDEEVLRVLALQAPVASDLREVVAIKMIATDLERVGDLARNIAKSAARLAIQADVFVPDSIVRLAEGAISVLRKALNAFSECDAELAREVLAADDAIDAAQDEAVRDELDRIAGNPDQTSPGVDLILVAKNLERVGDHATNIAEDVILMAEARNVKHASKLDP